MMASEMMVLFLDPGTAVWTVVLGPLLAGTSWELLDISVPGLSPTRCPWELLEVGPWLGLGLGRR